MENNVVTLDTAKKLKAAGFPQTWLGWACPDDYENDPYAGQWSIKEWGDPFGGHEWLPAPTAQEIADQLPHSIAGDGFSYLLSVNSYNFPKPDHRMWQARYSSFDDWKLDVIADTMAEALAALYLKLQDSPFPSAPPAALGDNHD